MKDDSYASIAQKGSQISYSNQADQYIALIKKNN